MHLSASRALSGLWPALRLGCSRWEALWLTGKWWKSMYVHRGKALESVALLIVETAYVLIVETARPELALELL